MGNASCCGGREKAEEHKVDSSNIIAIEGLEHDAESAQLQRKSSLDDFSLLHKEMGPGSSVTDPENEASESEEEEDKEEEEEEEGEVVVVSEEEEISLSVVNANENKRTASAMFSKQGSKPIIATGKNALLFWCQQRTEGYANVNITNFSKSFKDGLAFCALIHSYKPNLIPFHTLKAQNHAENLELAFSAAEKLGVERLFDVCDITDLERPEPKSITLYVTELKETLEKL